MPTPHQAPVRFVLLWILTLFGGTVAVFGDDFAVFAALILASLWGLIFLAIAIEYPHFMAWLFSRPARAIEEHAVSPTLVRLCFGLAGFVITAVVAVVLSSGRFDLIGY